MNNIWKLDDMSKVVRAYFFVFFAIFLFMPDGLGLAGRLPWTQQLPLMSWIAPIPGVLPVYADCFALICLLMPAWLVVLAVVYARNYSSHTVQLPALLLVIFIMIGALALLLTMKVHMDGVTWRQQVFIYAARHRTVGAPFLSALTLPFFIFLGIVVAKAPIDFYRRLFNSGATQ